MHTPEHDCKNVDRGRLPCPSEWPYKPRIWCGPCRIAADLAPAGTVIPFGSAEAQVSRRVSGAK